MTTDLTAEEVALILAALKALKISIDAADADPDAGDDMSAVVAETWRQLFDEVLGKGNEIDALYRRLGGL